MTVTLWWNTAGVCVCTDTEAGLCRSYKAVHSGAGGLEPVTLQTAHLLSTFITCLPRMNHPRLLPTNITFFLPRSPSICDLTLASISHLLVLSALDLHKHGYSLSSLKPPRVSSLNLSPSPPLGQQQRGLPSQLKFSNISGEKCSWLGPILPFRTSPTLLH